jgi:hypothetical protein
MRQSPPPDVFRSSIPWHGIGSKDWVPSTYVQRVGAFVIGVIYVMAAAGCVTSTIFIKSELTAELQSESAGIVIGFLFVSAMLIVGVAIISLGIRLLKGAFRSGPKPF